MDYRTAKKLFTSRCPYNSVFPYTERDSFVQVTIPIRDIHFWSETARRGEWWSEYSKTVIQRLIEIPDLDPIWVKYLVFNGREWKPRWHKKMALVDGNHRTAAKIRRGDTTIEVFIPKKHYKAYLVNRPRYGLLQLR